MIDFGEGDVGYVNHLGFTENTTPDVFDNTIRFFLLCFQLNHHSLSI